ncbi:MAG: nucleoside kinase [Defluviitaleaceae bacterium]|nr:nucleoside kinase [Defluviitaleaceae bacterium]
MSELIKINVMGEEVEIIKGTTLYNLSERYTHKLKYPIVLATVDNGLKELSTQIKGPCKIEFFDITNPNGFRVYQRSLFFIMFCAIKDVIGKDVRIVINRSINKNYFCELSSTSGNEKLTDDVILKIESRMKEIVKQELPISKVTLSLEDGMAIAHENNLLDKIGTIKFRRTGWINFYELGNHYNYFYGTMAINTKYFTNFKLHRFASGLILQMPEASNPSELTELAQLDKMSKVFDQARQWREILNTRNVCELNNNICDGKFSDIVRLSEALHEKRVAELADMITNKGASIVLIAGPSSSGKTTFANRLSIQLNVNGFKARVISMDNYFKPAKEAELDEFGRPNFETISHVDVELLNNDLSKIVNGEEVPIPTYNFKDGRGEYHGDKIKIGDKDILIVEGIHGLNSSVATTVPTDKKFKIFISALTQISIDDHNRIPTSDTRLIRRMVRDFQFRNYSATDTLNIWPSVARGEAKYIFPFQEEADAYFNSALAYELCILKQFAEPLLFGITSDSPQYTEARRLVKFLDSFLGCSSEHLPSNSIIREFIGGSCFKT